MQLLSPSWISVLFEINSIRGKIEMKLGNYVLEIFYVIIQVNFSTSKQTDDDTTNLRCEKPDGKRPFSISVTSVQIYGNRVDRTTPPPYGYSEEIWGIWDYNYNVTAAVSYVVTYPSHCTQKQPFDSHDCIWPNAQPNIVWYLSNLDDSNFTQKSVSTRQPNGEYLTTVTANDPIVIPHVVAKLSLQTENLAFRYDVTFDQFDFHDNSWQKSYHPVTFNCYPPAMVRATVGQELSLNWSFTIKPKLTETKAHLLNQTLWFQAYMLDKEYLNRPPKMYYNKLQWGNKLSDLSREGTPVDASGFGRPPYDRAPGLFRGELEELTDGYKVNLQLYFTANNVGPWMKGMMRLNVGGIKSVIHVGVDQPDTNTTTLQYYRQYYCPFDMDSLHVEMHYSWTSSDVSYERYIEADTGQVLPNNAQSLRCRAYGCNIDKLQLWKNGQLVKDFVYYQPDYSDTVFQTNYGAYKEIHWYLAKVGEDTFGSYECVVKDKSGNSTSKSVDLVPKTLVKAKILEWTANYIILTCRSTGKPLPSLSFNKKEAWAWGTNQMPSVNYSQVTENVRVIGDSWFTDEPTGRVTEATVNITMPVDLLKDTEIVCRSHNIYGDKIAVIELHSYLYPRKFREW